MVPVISINKTYHQKNTPTQESGSDDTEYTDYEEVDNKPQ